MTTVYFDVTDIVYFAARYSRLTGIQRVQLNIITLLARKHGGQAVRCTLFDKSLQCMYEFEPTQLSENPEFDAERFLLDLGRGPVNSRFPSRASIKSYLRRYNNRKWLRTLKKLEILAAALFIPSRLAAYGLNAITQRSVETKVTLNKISALPAKSVYVCMGSVWLHPEVLAFCRRHSAHGDQVIQMVYDMIPIVHPEYYTQKEAQAYATWLNEAFDYVSRFICISQWTARDLINYASSLGRTPRAHAIPLAAEFLGFDRNKKMAASAELSDLVGKSYVLCVGTIEQRKNGIALLKVWQKLHLEFGTAMPLLVFAGKYGKGSDEFQAIVAKDAELARLVRVVHSPSDGELAWLYQSCVFTVFPSCYEGWGLPVGESAWFGKYCLASRTTSIPEVCGDLMDYVDPADLGGIVAGVRRVLSDRDYLASRESAIIQATLRRWIDVADDIHRFSLGEAM